jgi:hypothetical protein
MTEFWKKHSIKQVSPQHTDNSDAKASRKNARKKAQQIKQFDKLEGMSPSLANNSNDASIKHEGY